MSSLLKVAFILFDIIFSVDLGTYGMNLNLSRLCQDIPFSCVRVNLGQIPVSVLERRTLFESSELVMNFLVHGTYSYAPMGFEKTLCFNMSFPRWVA